LIPKGARELGYRQPILRTNDILVAARRIHQSAGFRLVSEARRHSSVVTSSARCGRLSSRKSERKAYLTTCGG
jgi:hypothetical protein